MHPLTGLNSGKFHQDFLSRPIYHGNYSGTNNAPHRPVFWLAFLALFLTQHSIESMVYRTAHRRLTKLASRKTASTPSKARKGGSKGRQAELESSPGSKFTLSDEELSSSLNLFSPSVPEPPEHAYSLRRRSAPAYFQKNAAAQAESSPRKLRERNKPIRYTLPTASELDPFWTDEDLGQLEEGGNKRQRPNDDFSASLSEAHQERRMTRSASQLVNGGEILSKNFRLDLWS